MARKRNPRSVRNLPRGYAELDAYLSGKDQRTLANNTVVFRSGEDEPRGHGDTIAVVLHSTKIAEFWPDGMVKLNTGGWMTTTTKARINNLLPLPWGIASVKRNWYIFYRGEKVEPFFDNMQFNVELDPHDPEAKRRVTNPCRKTARAYVTGDFGDSDDYEARIEHDVDAAQQDDFAPYDHPGKFEGQPLIVLRLYAMTMDGADEDIGETEGFGYYGLLRDVKTADGVLHFIVEEDSQGFFSIWESATNKKRIDESWARIQDEAEHYEEGD